MQIYNVTYYRQQHLASSTTLDLLNAQEHPPVSPCPPCHPLTSAAILITEHVVCDNNILILSLPDPWLLLRPWPGLTAQKCPTQLSADKGQTVLMFKIQLKLRSLLSHTLFHQSVATL